MEEIKRVVEVDEAAANQAAQEAEAIKVGCHYLFNDCKRLTTLKD